jgi:hypothetical protein
MHQTEKCMRKLRHKPETRARSSRVSGASGALCLGFWRLRRPSLRNGGIFVAIIAVLSRMP